MADDRVLTPTQQAFINHLFTDAAGNLKKAAKSTIGTEEYASLMDDTLLAAIKRRADNELILSVPKAILTMQNMLEDPESVLFMDKVQKLCSDILDRAGLSKTERAGNNTMTVGIVMLPSKSELPQPPVIEAGATFLSPVLLQAPSRD